MLSIVYHRSIVNNKENPEKQQQQKQKQQRVWVDILSFSLSLFFSKEEERIGILCECVSSLSPREKVLGSLLLSHLSRPSVRPSVGATEEEEEQEEE